MLGSRRRPRRTSGTLLPRKSLPEETEQEEENVQQQNDALPKELLRVPEGPAEPRNKKLGTDAIPTSLQPGSNQGMIPTVQPSCKVRSSEGIERIEKDNDKPIQIQPDSIDTLGRFETENLRTKWFLQETNSPGPRENASPFMVNGDVSSTCSSKRPSLESSKGSSEEMDGNKLFPVELPLKKRKSLSDSLLCNVPQNGEPTQNGDLNNSTPSDQNINRRQYIVDTKGKLSPTTERKQNYSKQNGSPFSNKKALYSNGPCIKHSDEEANSRNRTTTHPCYDPMDLSKRRRNAACTVAILSPSDRGSENDFLETKI